jgi:predicted DsbA family dithiol-disulfide isomerase
VLGRPGCGWLALSIIRWQRAAAFLKLGALMKTRSVEVWLYQDLLCAWSYVASARIAALSRDFGDAVRWRIRPYPLRLAERVPSAAEISSSIRDIEMARREPEGRRLSPDLWTSGDAPDSRISPLIALEAAGLQGPSAHSVFSEALRRAALEGGINVARPDVALELAGAAGLDMNRFAAAYHSPHTRRLILEEHRNAEERGIKRVPTLIIDRRWMISGLRDVSEYARHLRTCLAKLGLSTGGSSEQMLH